MTKIDLIETLKMYKTIYADEKKMVEDTLTYLEANDVFLGKSNPEGHVTGSAWIVNENREMVLLTHHFKLNMWVQLGGHTEIDESVFESAYREGLEESGLSQLKALHKNIFDVDVHLIPEKGDQKAHFHYDIRYVFEANCSSSLEVSDESHDVKWIPLTEIKQYTEAWSVLRMIEKTENL